MMSQLRGSQHYIWSLADVLGQGATGAVYKARHKQTGELYAVKTFNQMSYMRSPAVQKREFDVLQKLNHENIVRLLAIEEETSSHTEVLVMELCTGGSLYGLLDDPENAYGIEETEFQRVLIDVASGMKYLRDIGIVHRDIKPGNIMCYINEDGRSIYKLIDFGAARELQDEEQFMSLYGTEEYLFPDMYERAVLRRPSGKQFSASVDLWSLGVTLYHVATGQLPFRPFGGRKNKDTMYRITSEKKSGVISGVQHSEGGPIDWSRHLPSTCRLSQGMKQLITPVLARLLECDHENMMMQFDDFFDAVKVITSKHIIYAFDLSKSSLLHIYINRNEHLAQFQELLAEQTDIRKEDQQLLFENHDFEKIVKPLQTVSSYPHTSAQNPIYLFSDVHSLITMPPTCNVPPLPAFTTDVALDNDAILAKNCCAILHYIRRQIIDAQLKQQLITKAAKMYLLVMVREIEHNKDSVLDFSSRVEETGKRLNLLADTGGLLMATVTNLIKAGPNEAKKKCQIDNLNNGLQWSSVSNQKESFSKLKCDVQKVKQQIESLNSQVVNEVLSWLDSCGCEESNNCIPKADILVSSTKATVADFARDRSLKKLSFNEEQIHKFDKHKLKVNYTKAATLIQNYCYPKTKELFERFHTWYSKVCKVQQQLQLIKNEVEKVSEWQSLLTERLSQVQTDRQLKLKALLSDLGIALELPDTITPETGGSTYPSSFDFVLRSKRNKEVRELLSNLKEGVLMNCKVTKDAKLILEDTEKRLHHMKQRHIEDEAKNMSPNCTNDEPTTLTAD